MVEVFSEIFEEPKGLPPQREIDHFIHLQLNSTPVNVRPYRFSQFEKGKIEKLVRELLNQGSVKPNY